MILISEFKSEIPVENLSEVLLIIPIIPNFVIIPSSILTPSLSPALSVIKFLSNLIELDIIPAGINSKLSF